MTFIYTLRLVLKLLLVFYINTHATDSYKVQQVKCDIVIGGGSTAALSAAITAATSAQLRNESILTCLVEPTDWPGGQLTNEGVSAIDYGKHNSKTQNQPQSFRSLLSIFNGTNPGDCTVSITCFQPQYLLNKWIFPKILNLSLTNHLRIFYNTMIIDTFSKYNPSSITSIKAVQRISLNNSFPWTHLLSEQLTDWYSTQNSKYYNKTILNIEGKIFIEGTEFSDILMTSNINQIYQGVEEPEENSTTTNDQCGAAIVFPFFMKLLSYIPNNPPIVPVGNNEGRGYWVNGWDKAWIFRRALDSKHNGDTQYANINDISQQNMDGGNDFGTGYLYLSVNAAKQQYLNGNWMGGINMTVLKEIEQRAFGWYHFYVNHSYNSSLKFDLRQLIMDVNCTNTSYGLSKFPYIRDTRRSLGLYGFKLYYKYLRNIWNQKSNNSNNKYDVGYRFHDRIALGNYDIDIHHMLCKYPSYINDTSTVPFYIPFRSIATDDYSNLLIIGKNMAQSLYAGGATREHPTEWSVGVAGGATAQWMIVNNLTDTRNVYDRITEFQQYLQSEIIGQTIEWT